MPTGKNEYIVYFSITEEQITSIEKWLKEEDETGEGFYCNWENRIKPSIYEKRIAVIAKGNKTVGFITWYLTSIHSACIDIAEIEPTHRNRGLCKELTNCLFKFFRQKGIFAVELQCAPASSEIVWKRIGFKEFDHRPDNYKYNSGGNKKLYQLITPYLDLTNILTDIETVELWNDEPHTKNGLGPATYMWNIEFKPGTRTLNTPIIHPADCDWRIRWQVSGNTVKDDKVKRVGAKIDFGSFIIVKELQML